MIRVLFAGTGHSGSWAIRGEQLSGAVGQCIGFQSSAIPTPSRADFARADVVILVKRAPLELFDRAHDAGKMVIWDPVDFWTQKCTSAIDPAASVRLLRGAIKHRRPHGVLFTNRTMQRDALFTGLSMVLPHHHYPHLRPRNVPDRVRRVVYHGGPFLGQWEDAIRDALARHRVTFDTRTTVEHGDIAVAFRGGEWDGYMSRAWKSNVKLANAHACGIPFVCEPAHSYTEQGCGDELTVRTPDQLADAFARLMDKGERVRISQRFTAHSQRYTLGRVARSLADFLLASL